MTKQLECTIFNVEHGFCAFIKSPNNYGLMIDCGKRNGFSPIKWVRKAYNYGNGNIVYHEGRRIAELIITHLHEDHFTDVGSFYKKREDKPKILLRDKETLKFIRDKIINNRSYIIGIGYAGKKILIPGDIETEGWEKAFQCSCIREILKGTNFFITSHHGRESGCNADMLEFTGIPDIYIVSARAKDDTFYSFYSKPGNAKGYVVHGDDQPSQVISTKRRKQSIHILINEYGETAIYPIVTPDNQSVRQEWLSQRKTKQVLRGWGA